MSGVFNIRNYGTKFTHDFPNPDDVRKTLNDADIACIKDLDTSDNYILTKHIDCWTQIDNFKLIERTNKNHMEKVYQVEFMAYTNCTKDTVSNYAKEKKRYKIYYSWLRTFSC